MPTKYRLGKPKVAGRGGGISDISNSIFSNSISSDIFQDEYSEIRIEYSLSDSSPLPGDHNLFGSPNFVNPDSLDFRIPHNSIAINSGDPNYTLDPDGSRTNLGSSYYNFNTKNDLVISEINYNSSPEFNTHDWIEFFNPNNYKIDISKWIFKDENDDHMFIFSDSTVIDEKSYIVICENYSEFSSHYPFVINVVGEFSFGLNNSGEHIRLFDNFGNVVDSLTYNDSSPWPDDADGKGYTLQLIDHELDNSKEQNWTSDYKYGTPGSTNILVSENEPEETIPTKYSLSQNYPNPFNPTTTIQYDLPQDSHVKLNVYDILGRIVLTLVDQEKRAGTYKFTYNYSQLSSGIYFYRIFTDKYQSTKKMLLLK